MSYLALLLTVALQISGLWPHLDAPTKAVLTRGALAEPRSAVQTITLPVAVATPAPLKLESGSSAYAIDATSGQILYTWNANKSRPIASITKLMTVLVALSQHQPNDIITVGQLPNYDVSAETMGLTAGEKFRVIDLVKAALIPSYNDAADALAIATSGNTTRFAALMNAKARTWNIEGARFNNPTGLVDTGNTASAAAVAEIAQLDLASPLVRDVVTTTNTTISDTAGRSFNLSTTNDLLATGKFYGIKTGYTQAAGECFVGLTKVHGHSVITVVLGSSNRFGETQSLVNWIGQNWLWP